MKSIPSSGTPRRLFPLVLAVALACAAAAPPVRAASPEAEPAGPWSAADLLEPAAFAKTLASPAKEAKFTLICVGFPFLYHGGHIPGAVLAGPARNVDGIRHLKETVQDLPRDRPIVIYCGCCPMKDCPNIRPAFRTLHTMGFKDVRVLVLRHDFGQDWADQGYPTQKGD
jgi:3-mercaptopyruvate sulfurtransferase SseA